MAAVVWPPWDKEWEHVTSLVCFWWQKPVSSKLWISGVWRTLFRRSEAPPLVTTRARNSFNKPICSPLQGLGPWKGKIWKTVSNREGKHGGGGPLCSTPRWWIYLTSYFTANVFHQRTCTSARLMPAWIWVGIMVLALPNRALRTWPRRWRRLVSGVLTAFMKGWSTFEPIFCCSWQDLANVTLVLFF